MGMTLKKSEILFLSFNVRNPNRSAHSFFSNAMGMLPSLFPAAVWNQWPDKYVFRVFLPVHEKISKNSHNKRKKMYVHSAFTNFFSIWPQKWPKVTEITLIWKKTSNRYLLKKVWAAVAYSHVTYQIFPNVILMAQHVILATGRKKVRIHVIPFSSPSLFF